MRPSIAIIFMSLTAPLAALALPHPGQNNAGLSQDLSIRQSRNGGRGPQNGRPQPAPQSPRGGPIRPQPSQPPVDGSPTPVPTTIPADSTPVDALPTTLPDVVAPVDAAPEDGSCDISALPLPANAQALPRPSTGLKLILIAMGTGTQNYTCADPTAKPVGNGAIATLTKANCAVAGGGADDASVIGNHFFADSTTPEFDVAQLGKTQLKKIADTPSPSPTTNVALLKLQAQAQGTTSNVKEIYRLETRGGVAPADCSGQVPGSTVKVNYTAQYWFFA